MTTGVKRNLIWTLLLLAVVLTWWVWRSYDDNGRRVAADSAWTEADPDDILVDFKDDIDKADVAKIGRRLGIDLVLVSSQSLDERFYRAHVPAERRDAILADLAKLPSVEIAEPDAEFYLVDQQVEPGGAYIIGEGHQDGAEDFEHRVAREAELDAKYKGFPNDPQYKYQWHLRQIGMPAAWKLADGKDVIVAVIDTGVAYEKVGRFHRVPDLDKTRFVKPYNFVANNQHANDDHGHGTHVAGTIAQNTNNKIGVAGVAPGATIMPLKVLSASGSGSLGAIADAIRYAADNGANVINMSLGGPFPSKILQKAVTYAHKKGVVVVCAAGNNGRGKLSFPAAYADAFAVAATQYDETTTFYSNWGKGLDISAPGGNTKVDQNDDGMPDGVLQNTLVMGDPGSNGYFPYMGTSMAAPHVAGVAALVVAQGVTEPKAVEAILMETSRHPKKANYSKEKYGAGIVDAPAAIRASRKKTGGLQLTLGVLFALAIATHTRRQGMLPTGIGRFVATSGLSASGLFFLPFLGSVGAWLAQLPGIAMLTRGVPAMDMALLGPAGHGNVLFYSALIPFVLAAFGYGVTRLRPYIAGIAAGVGASLLFQFAARTTDIQWMVWDSLWLAVNAAVCGALAYLALLSRN